MTVGISHSGGGITGLLASMCVMNSLDMTYMDYNFTAPTVAYSTTSGGSIGYGIYANTGEAWGNVYYPRYDSSISYADVTTELSTDEKIFWFANANAYLEDIIGGQGVGDNSNAYQSIIKLPSLPTETGWWIDIIDACFYIGYGVHDYDIIPGTRKWYVNFGQLKENKCPISVDSDTGVYPEAESSLYLMSMDVVDGTISSPQGWQIQDEVTTLDAMSYSSAFWAATIVESQIQYALMKSSLMSTEASGANDKKKEFYLMDGGLVDTTGIVAHLQQGTSSIIAFYSNNEDLEDICSPLAYLFGDSSYNTDSMNHLEGPVLGQVFADTSLFSDVLANLTNPSILRARLTSVTVMDNAYLGISGYTLDSLLIFSNQYSENFVGSFEDEDIAENLDANFPNKFPVALPTLDANMLCMFNDYKVQMYKDEIADALSL